MSEPRRYRTLRVEIEAAVAHVTLDRPARRNAIDDVMASELAELLRGLAWDAGVRVVVLRGEGGEFCSGGDLAQPRGDAPSRSRAASTFELMSRLYGEAALALQRLPKPVIAAVEGTAAGAGANLAFGCDFVIAAEGARFSQIFVRRGLTLDFGGSWLLPRLVGLRKAKELAMLGDWIDAREAERLGLVNRVLAAAEFEPGVRELAARLAAQAPLALTQIKRALDRSFDVGFEESIEQEATAQAMIAASEDFEEGVRAFLERRPARFKGA